MDVTNTLYGLRLRRSRRRLAQVVRPVQEVEHGEGQGEEQPGVLVNAASHHHVVVGAEAAGVLGHHHLPHLGTPSNLKYRYGKTAIQNNESKLR